MENYNDAPASAVPVTLQPFKALKIVFMVLAIVSTALWTLYALFFGVIIGSIGVLLDAFADSSDSVAWAGVSGFYYIYYLIFSSIFVVAFWVLFGVFNSKYKERVERNANLGFYVK